MPAAAKAFSLSSRDSLSSHRGEKEPAAASGGSSRSLRWGVAAALTCAAFVGFATPSHAQAPDALALASQANGLALKADATALCALVGKMQVIVFKYGYDPVAAEPRELEPYAVGYTKQRKILLFGRQVKGFSKSSSNGAEVALPGWRNFRIDKIDKGVVNARVSTFDPVRPAPDEHRYISEFVCKNDLVQ